VCSSDLLKNKKFIAFTGIGNPDNFFKLLLNNNIKITKTIIYPDHFQYTKKDYNYLLHEAKKNNCHLITTEKDYVRINSNYKKKFYYTKINTIFNKKKLIYNSFKKLHS
jgi:tetraacyldisaccharide 4'-kinase